MNFLYPSSPMSTSRYQSTLSNHNFCGELSRLSLLLGKVGCKPVWRSKVYVVVWRCLIFVSIWPHYKWSLWFFAGGLWNNQLGDTRGGQGRWWKKYWSRSPFKETSHSCHNTFIIPSIRRDMTVEEDTCNFVNYWHCYTTSAFLWTYTQLITTTHPPSVPGCTFAEGRGADGLKTWPGDHD